MKYYRLLDDINFLKRWHLRGLIGIDGTVFVRPPMVPMNSPLRDGSYEVDLQVDGRPMDYTTTSFRSVPIVSFNVVKALSGLDGFTVFPVRVRGIKQKNPYFILHVWDEVDCVDEDRSEYEKFEINDPVRPDLAGRYSCFFKLFIDQNRASGKNVFRLARSGVEIIVSEVVKDRFEKNSLTGAVFELVT